MFVLLYARVSTEDRLRSGGNLTGAQTVELVRLLVAYYTGYPIRRRERPGVEVTYKSGMDRLPPREAHMMGNAHPASPHGVC